MNRLPTPIKTVTTLIVVAVAATVWLSGSGIAAPNTPEFALEAMASDDSSL